MNFKGYQFLTKSKGRKGGKKPWVANYRIVTRCISLDAQCAQAQMAPPPLVKAKWSVRFWVMRV